MTITEMRALLDQIRALAQHRQYDEIETVIQQAAALLANDRLLTTREAAEWLCIGSVNTIKAMARAGKIGYVMHGSHMRIPLSEVQRVQDSGAVRDVRVLEHLHDQTATLGSDNGMSEKELALLNANRPGTLPWKR